MTVMTYRRPIAAALVAIALVGGPASAHAADSVTGRVTAGLGQWIAAQGNAALKQIREDLTRDLSRHLKPLLPESEDQGADHGSLRKVGTDPASDAPSDPALSI